jgi:hypothetical protein
MAFRMKNSRSVSIASAYPANLWKCAVSPRRSGMSRDSRADLRIQKSSSIAQRSSVASSSGNRWTSEPITSAARLSTSAQVPDVRSSSSTITASRGSSSARRSASKMTAASLHSNTGPSHNATDSAVSPELVKSGCARRQLVTMRRMSGTVVPLNSSVLLR